MKKRPHEERDEDRFARDLEEKFVELLKHPQSEVTSEDPAVESALPVLDLIEEVRRFRQSGDPAATDTPTAAAEFTDLQGNRDSVSGTDYTTIGRFRVVEQLGQGGFGTVFRAHDTKLGREVAIKIPKFEATLHNESRQRFAREAETAAALNHRHVVSLLETGTDGGVDYIVCELVEGHDLSQKVALEGPLSPEAAARLARQLAGALEHAHERGILHRDLKPSNVLIDGDTGHARISDFGLASFLDAEQDITRSGAALGTPAFMAPEQAAANRGIISPATDIYGLGAILYFSLCGAAPCQAGSTMETLRAVSEEDPASFKSRGLTVPRDLEAICDKCLEKQPARRYATPNELADDLDRFLAGEPVLARPVNSMTRFKRWVYRHPWIAVPATAALIFMLAALAATGYGLHATKELLVITQESERQSRANYIELKRLVDVYFKEIEADTDLKNVPGARRVRERLLGRALEYYEQLAQRNDAQRNDNDQQRMLAQELADTEIRIGRILIEIGRPRDALARFESAKQRIASTSSGKARESDILPLTAQLNYQMAVARNLVGEREAALEDISVAIESLRSNSAEGSIGREQLAKALRYRSRIHRELRNGDQAADDGKEAVRLFDELADSSTGRESLSYELDALRARGELALVYKTQGQLESAFELGQQNFAACQAVLAHAPNSWAAAELLVLSAMDIAKHLVRNRQPAQAVPYLESAQPVANRLAELHPEVSKYSAIEVGVQEILAACYDQLGEPAKAETLFVANLDAYRELATSEQATFDDRLRFAAAINNLVTFRSMRGIEFSGTHALLQEASNVCESLVQQEPKDEHAQLLHVGLLQCRAWESEKAGDIEHALEHSAAGLDILEKLRSDGARHPQTVAYGRMLHDQRAQVLEKERRYQEALEHRIQSASIAEQMRDPHKANLLLALAHLRLDQNDAAKSSLSRVDLSKLADDDQVLLAQFYALKHRQTGNSQITQWATKALQILEELAARSMFASPGALSKLNHPDLEALTAFPEFQKLVSQPEQLRN